MKIKRICKIMLLLILIVLCLLGLMQFAFGAVQRHQIKKAAEQYQAVQVRITETRFSDSSRHLLVVVLEPAGEQAGDRRRIGRTVATTGNRRLAVGDTLTMYYDPQNPDTRIVDFNTWKPLFCFGGILGIGMLALLVLIAVLHGIRKRRSRRPAAQIRP